MRTLLAPAHLALTIIIVVWDIALAGRIAQNRQAPPVFQALSGLAALLVLPGLLFVLATSTIVTGRAVSAMDWIWPAVLILFAAQALYALARRLVNPAWGIPIVVYDILIAVAGVTRYAIAHGAAPAAPFVTLVAAQSMSMVFMTGTSTVLATPFYLNVPMVSPAFPAISPLTVLFRFGMSALGTLWVLVILTVGAPPAVQTLRNFAAHRGDQLHDRPAGDFAVGLKILPDVKNPPLPMAIRDDSALADTLDVDALAVVVVPGASRAALDSVAKIVAAARLDSTVFIVAIGYEHSVMPELRHGPLDQAARLATVKRVVDLLHPDILLPAEDPYGSGQRALGELPAAQWESYLTQAASVARAADRHVRIGLSASSYSSRDSALYAWAAAPGSPIDIVGFSLFPSPYVGGGIGADTRTADRWMRSTPTNKPQWVFAAGGYPLAYGEASQLSSIRQVLSWATDHPSIKGAVVYEAGDYGQARGLRAPNGRLRPAAGAVLRAIRQLQASAQ